jgi:integrase
VSIPDFLVEMLARQAESKRSDDLVFVGRDGAPLRRSNFNRRHWKPAVERAGLPSALRFHDLRHTHVAFLIAQGWDAYRISRRLGHSSIKTTLDRYGHLLPDEDDEGLARAGRSLREVVRFVGPAWDGSS